MSNGLAGLHAHAQACNPAGTTVTLDYSTRAANEDWRNRPSAGVPSASSFTQASTTYNTANTSSSTLATGSLNNTQTLVWSANASNTSNTSTVTYTFNRSISNLTIRVQDIDAVRNTLVGTSGFVDQVQFSGSTGPSGTGTTVIPSLSRANTVTTYTDVVSNSTTATATGKEAGGDNTSPDNATVIATYGSPVQSITLTYKNISTAGTLNAQSVGIDQLAWCRITPTATNITNTSRPGGQVAASVNSLSATADGAITSYTVTGLTPSQGTFYANGVALTNGQTLTPAQASQLTFAPAGSFSGTAGFSYTATDDGNVVSNVATYAVPVTATGASGTPAPCATAGKDGSVTISANPNTYYPATASATAGATTLSVGAGTLGSAGAANTIMPGDLLLVIQMQGADINSTNTDSYGDGVAGGGASGNLTTNFQAGTYEYVVAANPTAINQATGGTITLASGLVNSYVNAAPSATAGPRRFQVVRIPQYINLTLGGTITATPWNGSIGGIIALDVAGQTNFNGNLIDASARGFRGGGGRLQAGGNYRSGDYVNVTDNAQKGEGIAGTPRFVNAPTNPTNAATNVTTDLTTVGYPVGSTSRGAPGNAGGGANDNGNNSGGGGGANGANGGRGGNNFTDNLPIGGEPGSTFSPISSSRIVLGGGGGAGTNDTNTGTPTNGAASSGAPGGGIVLLRTSTLVGTGTIAANGGNANTSLADDGSGGGGGGGTILVTATNTAGLANLTLQANGGTGGSNTGSANGNGPHGPGGGGGGGVILTNGNVASASVAAGANGTTRNANASIAYGATSGLGGVANTGISTSIAGSTAGATCRPAPVANNITNSSRPSGQAAASVNSLSATTFGTIASYTVTGLNAAQGTFYVNGVVLNTTNFPGLQLTPTQASQLSFAPAASFSGTAGFSYTATDDVGVVSNSASYSVPVTATGGSGTPAPCATAGKDGSPTISENPNTYYPSTATQTLAAGATSISVGVATVGGTTPTPTSISKGDLLLVIQMQGADINSSNTDAYGDGVAGGGASGNLQNANFTAGTYEYVVASNTTPITAAAGGTITLATPLVNSYVNAPATTSAGPRRFQVVRVPQYINLTLGGTLAATPWNGSIGGIIVLDVAGQTTFSGNTITAAGRGFRGGGGRTQGTQNYDSPDYVNVSNATTDLNAQKGEGTAGTPRYVNVPTTVNNATTNATVDLGADGYPGGTTSRGAPGNAGGGGNDDLNNAGGGGGANGGFGGRGGNSFSGNKAIGGEPGASFGLASSSRLVLGGGGGAGSTNNATGTPGSGYASSGAAGGGIVMLRTGSISGTGTISANGGSANNSVADDGSGGGGAGGSILVTASSTASLSGLTLTANGGTGGTNTGSNSGPHGPGGGGGGGVILTNGGVASASVVGGANGTTQNGTAGTTGNPYNSSAGLGGVSNTGISNNIANSVSGASSACSADVATTLSGPQSLNAGQPSGTFTATYTNYGLSTASSVTQQVTIPAGATNVLVNGASYTPTGNVINFGTAATLASGATNTFTYSFTAPTTMGPVTQTSNVGTASSEGPNGPNNTGPANTGTYADAASFTSNVGAVTDVSTTIAAANATVATGQQGTFNVTFANAGPNSATSPTLQVQLPAGLSGVTVTGTTAGTTGSYDSTTGLVTYTYGTAGTAIPSGTTITSAINFTVPTTGSVTAAATIATATNELGRTANNGASATVAATPGADVATVISGPASTVAGTMTTYSVLTTNNGPSAATTVAQTVTLPTGLSNVFVSNGGTYNSATGVVTFPSLGTLASGSSANNTISFLAPTSAITATANVSTATTDAVPANNSSVANTSVTTPAANNPTTNVYTTITASGNNVAAGTPITFTVVAGNAGPNTAADVVERVALAPGLTGVTVSNGGTYNATTGIVTFPTVTSLASGSANTYTVTVNAPASGMVAATASIAATTNDQIAADNVATTDVTVNPPVDVATALTGPTEVGAGQAVTYTVTTTNNGLAPAANVVQTVTIPAGLASVTLSGSGTYDAATGLVTFPAITSQAAGSSVANTIQYTAPAAATLVNVASVSSASPDNVRSNNRSTVATTVDPISDVTVSISGPSTIVQGNQIDYAVVTTNNGPSVAATVATQVQLPPGLGTITLSTGGTYNNTTGVVTFPTIASQLPGSSGTVTNIIRFIAPSNLSQINATATVSAAATTEESNYLNNTASIITTETAPTTIQTDLSTNITASPNPPTAGQSVSFNVTTTNASSSTDTATGVVQRVALEAGLTISSITNGGTYDPATGVVTFPAISLTAGTTQTNTIVVVASGTIPLQVRALVTGDQSDPNSTNNTRFLNLAVTAAADVATYVSGPTTVATGDAVTYSVLTINNGPSPAASVAQTVTIPTGLPSGSVTVSGGGSYDSSTGIVTFPTIASEAPGAGGQVMNTISFTAPSTTYTVVGNVSTTTNEPATPGTTNNTSTVNVAPGNLAPVANAVVNALQTPQGNTAGPLLISPLSATDANGNNTIGSYRLTSIPNATTQGVLSLNGTALAANSVISAADAANLRFDPVAGFIGNAFFGYTATDNSGVASAAPALYTIPVGQDVNSFYTAYNATKGGANPYATGDVLAAVIDNNGARYTSTGTVYAANGALLANASNGLPTTGTNASLAPSGSGPASNPTNALPAGVSIDPATGSIYVSDRTQLVNLPQATTYQVNVVTTDVNGGVNTVLATFTLGANPLPVSLVAFTAQAVQNRDALLTWTTASELNNDRFEVKRSFDGTSFVQVGQRKGQGTKATASDYSFTDAGIGAQATSGQPVYYRLKQVDRNGTSTYSPVRSVSFTKAVASLVTLYPNPAVAATNLDLSALPAGNTYQVLLLDVTGRQVQAATLTGGQPQPLNLSNLATGTYHVVVTGTQADGSALRQTLRLTKE